MSSDHRPLVVCGPDGRPFIVLEENEKGYRKSLEQGSLWALHPGTGRLLPFYEAIDVTVIKHEGWYEARLAAEPPQEDRSSGDKADAIPPASGGATSSGFAAKVSDSSRAGRDRSAASSHVAGDESDRPDLGAVLRDLAAVIASRHHELPDGSYTTHLFTSGGEKIRKKAGEEAVELLLASSREALVSESADFIYHLLVLLENEGITLDELAAELKRR